MHLKNKSLMCKIFIIGIVYNKESQSQKFYDYHTDDILCLSLHPTKNYVSTGQVSEFFQVVLSINKV